MKHTDKLACLIMLLLASLSVTSKANVIHWLTQVQGEAGLVANNSSFTPQISTNGRYVTFGTSSTNMVTGDTNSTNDVIIRDLMTGENTLVTTLSNGEQFSDNISSFSAPTSDGRYVTFLSNSDVLPNASGELHLYLKDLQTGALTNISGYGTGDFFTVQFYSTLTDDAQYIYFATTDQIDPLHTSSYRQVYRKNLLTQSIELISIAADGMTDADDYITLAAVSDNGRYAVISSRATNLTNDIITGANLTQLYLRDLTTQTTTLINITPSGAPSIQSVGSTRADVSNTGQVIFTSSQSDLVPNDNNNLADVFIFLNGNISRINLNISGNEVTEGGSSVVKISGDGSRMVFASDSPDLDLNDDNNSYDIFSHNLTTGLNSLITTNAQNQAANSYSVAPELSLNGNRMVFTSGATNFNNEPSSGRHADNFVHQFSNQTFQKVTVPLFNPNTILSAVIIVHSSTDQNSVVFSTFSPNMTNDDVDPSLRHTYILDRTQDQLQLLAENADAIDMSPSGRYILLSSEFFQPGAAIELSARNVFLYDRVTGTYEQIDEGNDGQVSDDGMVVFKSSKAISNDDLNGTDDIYVFNPALQTIDLISLGLDGLASGGDDLAIGGIGSDTWVVFDSSSEQLVNNDTNGVTDVFMKNLPNGNIFRISQTSAGLEGNANSYSPSISNNGRVVAFTSDATNLTTDDYSLAVDSQVLYYDRISTLVKLASRNEDGLPLYSDYSDIYYSSVSETGRYIAYKFRDHFSTEADFTGDDDLQNDVVLFDTQSQIGRIVSLDSGGQHVASDVGYNFQVMEHNSVSPALVGVLFTAKDPVVLTGITNHPGHEELFLYQQGGPDIELNIEVIGPGTVSGSSGINCLMSCIYDYALGTNLTLVATPDSGMLFERWEEDFGGCDDDVNPCELIMDRSKTLRAYFVDPNEQIFADGFE